ncbi:DUF2059 domain-containing protein [Pseudaestuariivita rosea]|uniref:DUF2059 domain-containing protein n=1 Tax=Pseudaestuariivita rosea TaxID=2763263 RepID=UPI001ABABEDE|nr:DUF2059 domain-containing protein [Pseudaestuariivita rosea]
MFRFLVCGILMLFLPMTVFAQNRVDPLVELMKLDEIIAIMREEGLSYGDDLAEDMFAGPVSSGWPQTVSGIYDAERMRTTLISTFDTEMEGVDLAPLETFFASDLGQKIIRLELSAREAFLEDGVEEAANERFRQLDEEDDARLALIKEFARANDLIDSNVVGAMNSNYAFFVGLIDSGQTQMGMTEDQILSDVWQQEPEIRANTTEWLYSYQLLAYQPLNDEELQAYLDFSRTDEAQAMNRALFAAFDLMFKDISRALGMSVGQYMGGQEL